MDSTSLPVWENQREKLSALSYKRKEKEKELLLNFWLENVITHQLPH